MSIPHDQFWRSNVQSKVKEVQQAANRLVTTEVPKDSDQTAYRRQLGEVLTARLDSLADMFGKEHQPLGIHNFRSAARSFLEHRHQHGSLEALMTRGQELDNLVAESETPRTLSFHDIFESHKEDRELNELADQLVAALERIIQEGETELNARLHRDLQRLLAQIQGIKSRQLYEWVALAEIAGKVLSEILLHSHAGLPGGALLFDAILAASKLKHGAFLKFQASQHEFVRLLEVKGASEDPANLPELDDATIKKLGVKLGLPSPEIEN